jgi:nucleoside phosphorylase
MTETKVALGGGNFSVGFITALVSHELVSCEATLVAKGWVERPTDAALEEGGIRKWSKSILGSEVFAHSAAIGRMGQVASSLATFAFLSRCSPTDVYLTGIAGSLNEEKVHKGDVVVATNTHWRTQNRIFGEDDCDQYRSCHNPLHGHDSDLSLRIQRFINTRYPSKTRPKDYQGVWNVTAGEIFTWDYVIDSRRTTHKINADYPAALCVEMEAGGFLSAIELYPKLRGYRELRGFVVRGISDYTKSL